MATSKGPERPPGQRFLYWLAAASKEARERSELRPEGIAYRAGVSGETIRTFENARNWPRDPDRLMAAYAQEAGLDDARDLYQRALDLWRQHGTAPSLNGENDKRSPAQKSTEALKTAATRERARSQARGAAARRPNATRKKRATGG